MTTQTSSLDQAIQDFLARGGQVQELEGYKDVPRYIPAPRPSRAPAATNTRTRRVGSRTLPRDANGLTAASAAKVKKCTPDVKKLLDEGALLTDIRRQLGVSWCVVSHAARSLGYVHGAYLETMARWVPVIEATVEGLLNGVSVQETERRLGIRPRVFQKYWTEYRENNPLVEDLRRGHGPYAKHSDEDTTLMLMLYQELTDLKIYRVAQSLHIGERRAEELVNQYSVSHPPRSFD